jgi:GntR family transcriptional regulator
VNSNTVLRAIHLLRDEGLLEAGRGKAITVAGTPDQGALVSKVNELIRFAQSRGYGKPELLRMIEQHPDAT